MVDRSVDRPGRKFGRLTDAVVVKQLVETPCQRAIGLLQAHTHRARGLIAVSVARAIKRAVGVDDHLHQQAKLNQYRRVKKRMKLY